MRYIKMSRSAFIYCSIATMLGGIIAGMLSVGPLAANWQMRMPATTLGFVLLSWPVNLCLLRCFSQLSQPTRRSIARPDEITPAESELGDIQLTGQALRQSAELRSEIVRKSQQHSSQRDRQKIYS